MLVVTGTIRIAPQDLRMMRDAAKDMAQATRAEPGCRIYEFSEDIEIPGRFRVYEEWGDPAALHAHFRTAHMAMFRSCLRSINVLSRDICRFDKGAETAL